MGGVQNHGLHVTEGLERPVESRLDVTRALTEALLEADRAKKWNDGLPRGPLSCVCSLLGGIRLEAPSSPTGCWRR